MSNSISFYLLTDSHYVSHRNWVEGKPFTRRERGDQISLKCTPEILDAFIEKILADDDTNIVIFTGDNIDDGDMNSHEEFRERLEKLKTAGKRVLVTTATHDYCGAGDDESNFHSAKRYTLTGTEPIPFMRKSGLFDFYYDFGASEAVSVHRESGSYIAKLGDGLRIAMIEDNGNGRSHCGLFEDGHKWLEEQIKLANEAGDYMLIAVHHPVVAPWEVFRHMAEYELYGGYQELSRIMCEGGVRAVFTGHTHVQSIRKYEDEKGRYFYNIATIAIANAAGKMRKVTVDTDAGVCDVKSVGIETLPGIDTDGKSSYEYLYNINFPGIVEKLLPLGARDYDAFLDLADGFLPVDTLKKFKTPVKIALRRLEKMKLKSIAKFGKVWKTMTAEQRAYAKAQPLETVIFEILRHIYTGNAPYTPDTAEYVSIEGAAARLDRLVERFNISKVKALIPDGSSLKEMAEDFLYNNRTGDDDAIIISLIRENTEGLQ